MTISTRSNYYTVRFGWRWIHKNRLELFTPSTVYTIQWRG